MRCSIVILTYNRATLLQRAVNSLRRTDLDDMEIIIVDNGSSPSIHDVWGSPKHDMTHVYLSRNMGVWARNLGFALAQGDYILQMDDDVVMPDPKWFEVMTSYMTEAVIAVGQQGSYHDHTWANAGNRPVPVGEYCDIVTGFCWLMRNEGYRYADYWKREGSFWHEETELQYQMRDDGWRFRVCPPVCSHASARTGEVDWEQHNAAWQYVRDKWEDRALKFEGDK